MEFDSKMDKNEAYQKFCVNYVNQLRDKLNFKMVDNKITMDLMVIRKKVDKVLPIKPKVPKWNVGKDTKETEKVVK